jgi:hypothetical protein
MRPRLFLVLLALGALAALVGVAATFADSPGARPAFALVDPNNGSPRLVAAHTQGFVAVSQGPFGPAITCGCRKLDFRHPHVSERRFGVMHPGGRGSGSASSTSSPHLRRGVPATRLLAAPGLCADILK